MEGALAALLDATGPAHRALESSPLNLRVKSREVTLDDYRDYLHAQLMLFVPWCEAYPQRLRRACRCDPAARLDALHLDLAMLGDVVLGEPALADFRYGWPEDSPAWWGALYVYESSRLEARTIAHHLRQQLGLCVAGALRFLDPVNEGAQPAWVSLTQVLERALPPASRPAAIEGALTVLEYFRATFAQVANGRDRQLSAA